MLIENCASRKGYRVLVSTEHRTLWLRVINNPGWAEEIARGRLSAPAISKHPPFRHGHCSAVVAKSKKELYYLFNAC